jgi:hypothetical protein
VVVLLGNNTIGIRLRDVIGVDNTMWDNMMWGSDYPHSVACDRHGVNVRVT